MGAVIRFIYPTLNVIDETQIYAAALHLLYNYVSTEKRSKNHEDTGFSAQESWN
jgi:hypothetical protein